MQLSINQQSQRYERYKAACRPRQRVLLAQCDLAIIDGTMHVTSTNTAISYHLLKSGISLGNAAIRCGLGLTFRDCNGTVNIAAQNETQLMRR
jgi:hypothetical protein